MTKKNFKEKTDHINQSYTHPSKSNNKNRVNQYLFNDYENHHSHHEVVQEKNVTQHNPNAGLIDVAKGMKAGLISLGLASIFAGGVVGTSAILNHNYPIDTATSTHIGSHMESTNFQNNNQQNGQTDLIHKNVVLAPHIGVSGKNAQSIVKFTQNNLTSSSDNSNKDAIVTLNGISNNTSPKEVLVNFTEKIGGRTRYESCPVSPQIAKALNAQAIGTRTNISCDSYSLTFNKGDYSATNGTFTISYNS